MNPEGVYIVNTLTGTMLIGAYWPLISPGCSIDGLGSSEFPSLRNSLGISVSFPWYGTEVAGGIRVSENAFESSL